MTHLYKEFRSFITDNLLEYGFNFEMNKKFILIKLIAFLTNVARKKQPSATPFDVILKIIDEDKEAYNLRSLAAFAAFVDYFMTQTVEFDSCGLTTSKEIVGEIKVMLIHQFGTEDDLPF